MGYKQSFIDIKQKISSVELEKLCGMSFGTANIRSSMEPLWKETHEFLEICIQGADSYTVPADVGSQALSEFSRIYDLFREHAARSNNITEFNRLSEHVMQQIRSQINQLRSRIYFFAIGSIHNAGLLNPAKLVNELQEKTSAGKADIEKVLAQVEKSRTEVDQFAKNIVGKARETARSVSFQAAQKQFASEEESLGRQLWVWGGISLALICGVAALVVWFYNSVPETAVDWRPVAIKSVIRLFSLSAVAGLLAYALSIFRAHLHMHRLNRHRQRVANCIGAFTEAGERPETRDLVLINLVETVCAFGNSGLLSDSADHIGSQKASVETISKVLSAASQTAKA